jgi:mono/diheme cytochrome c family protein
MSTVWCRSVLAVLLFAAFWVVLGFFVFLVAVRGGPSQAVTTSAGAQGSYRSRRVMGWVFVLTYVIFGLAIPALILIGNHNNANGQVGGTELTQAEKHGREIFGERCALCHTLAAANATGKVGPNLDVIQPTEQLVLHTIQYGCLQNPPAKSQEACLGEGTMPADVVQGVDAQNVAAFVAKVAGKE